MRRLAICVMGAALAFGSSSLAVGQDKEKVKIDEKDGDSHYKETTKTKVKHGKVKSESKVDSSDGTDSYSEKTKVKTKNGKTKITTETKGTPPDHQ